jgi:hypothetical protein
VTDTLQTKVTMDDEITSILDARLPQPPEWEDLPPALCGLLRYFAKRRAVCSEHEVELIDRQMLRLLRPYRTW